MVSSDHGFDIIQKAVDYPSIVSILFGLRIKIFFDLIRKSLSLTRPFGETYILIKTRSITEDLSLPIDHQWHLVATGILWDLIVFFLIKYIDINSFIFDIVQVQKCANCAHLRQEEAAIDFEGDI